MTQNREVTLNPIKKDKTGIDAYRNRLQITSGAVFLFYEFNIRLFSISGFALKAKNPM